MGTGLDRSGGPIDRQRYYNGVFKDGRCISYMKQRMQMVEKVKGNFIFYFINKDSVRQYQESWTKRKDRFITYDLNYRRKKLKIFNWSQVRINLLLISLYSV